MSEPTNKSLTKEQVRVKRTVIVVVVLLLLFISVIASVLVARSFENQQLISKIYGIWEEQNVPPYAQEIFEVRKDAIYVENRIVDTNYTFDGNRLKYIYQGQTYEYKVLDKNVTEMKRMSPSYYDSIFYIRGKVIPNKSANDSTDLYK
ncbi:DUF2850 domain-containing protein [Vibrio sp. TH_r3]|uniref:DUF2850 domain-containing protein n=1 Tax=Vibrio sp. TH_r3 TaxID=3082084 RepID=UPI0029550D9C|nr:DUF2850 domain-containing protein [Vibrio sp. TH_r3]MDV7104739.1 DUF2850 domain-containing protein [Vibrio sp. TH_r3]